MLGAWSPDIVWQASEAVSCELMEGSSAILAHPALLYIIPGGPSMWLQC